jgi:hypothetical protein
MIKHKKDSDALLEAFQQIQIREKDEEKHAKKKGKYDDGDDKEERCDHVPCEDDVAEEAKKQDKSPFDGHEEDEDDVQEESIAPGIPEDDIFKAVEMAEGGDWQEAIETTMSAIANHMINDIEQSGNGPLDEVETADVWNIKDGIKLAVEDLLSGQSAETYEMLTKNLRKSFHKGSNDKDLSRFFDGEPPMQEVHRNHEEPNIDPYDMIDR